MSITEKALFDPCDRTEVATSGARFVYTGSENCEKQLPSLEELKVLCCMFEGNPLTIVTPYMTDHGIKEFRRSLEWIRKESVQVSIVVNDWGVFGLMQREYTDIELSIGRVLSSRYLNRFYSDQHFLDRIEDETKRRWYCSFPEPFLDFLVASRVTSIEYNSYNQFRATFPQLKERKIKAHLYFPYTYLTTTRHCLYAHEFQLFPPEDVPLCSGQCRNKLTILSHSLRAQEVVLWGTAQYVRERTLPEEQGLVIDRVIMNDFKRYLQKEPNEV